MNIGFALCGSFCTYSKIFPIMEKLAQEHRVIPIFSDNAATVNSRFGTAEEHILTAERICGRPVLRTLAEVEPIGPKKLLDILVIAPCTGNPLSKLSHSVADTPVTMAAKSHLRNGLRCWWASPPTTAWRERQKTSGNCWHGRIIILSPLGRMIPRGSPPA